MRSIRKTLNTKNFGCVIAYRECLLMVIVFCTILGGMSVSLFAQFSVTPSIPDSVSDLKIAQFGTSKFGNIFIFSADATAHTKTLGGELTISQRYRGIGLRSTGASFRDDESFQLRYSVPIFDNINFISQNFYVLSNDTRNIGLANLQRINSLIGISSRPLETFTIELFSGVELFRQLGTSVSAPAFSTIGTLLPTMVDDYSITGNFQGNYTRFSNERTNADFYAQSAILREVNDGNALQTSAQYRLLNRDFITPIGTSATLATESRLEQRLGINGGFVYALSGKWKAEMLATIDNGAVDRMYRQVISDIPSTAVKRKLHEFQITISTALQYTHSIGQHRLGIEYFTRNEENSIERKFTLNSQDETSIRQAEKQRDNSALRTRIFGQSNGIFHRKIHFMSMHLWEFYSMILRRN
ncbi:MAG: hypothetical protein IPM69_06340 [Ignavibacteria bacterium]|nr:hypothetical protein [Ignavibacteria bacterium]